MYFVSDKFICEAITSLQEHNMECTLSAGKQATWACSDVIREEWKMDNVKRMGIIPGVPKKRPMSNLM